MAASYWHSTQRQHWTYTKQELATIRRKLEEADRNLVQQYPLPDRRLLSIYFYQQMAKLARPLSVRQQAIATAQVYVRRFYTKVEIRRTNPLLVLATAFYLACKMEECPQHIRLVVAEARHNWQTDFGYIDTSKLGECEFTLISEMNSQLIIHHPYRSLSELQSSFSLNQEEYSLAWSVINDHYLTDLPLLYPPHVIAITAIFLALALRPTQTGLQAHSAGAANALQQLGNVRAGTTAQAPPGSQQNRVQKLVNWIAESAVDIEALIDCTQEMISLYEIWEQFNDKVCREQINRFVKARGLDK